jgi:hypothetical protein
MTSVESAARPEAPADAAAEPPMGLAGLVYFVNVYEYATLADRKAAFFLSAGGLMLTVLAFFSGRLAILLGKPLIVSVPVALLLVAVVALILAAAVTAYVGYTRQLPLMPASLAVFRDIAARGRNDYGSAVAGLSHRQAMRDMLNYNYTVACWGAVKFRFVHRSLSFLRAAIMLWMLLLLVVALAR